MKKLKSAGLVLLNTTIAFTAFCTIGIIILMYHLKGNVADCKDNAQYFKVSAVWEYATLVLMYLAVLAGNIGIWLSIYLIIFKG